MRKMMKKEMTKMVAMVMVAANVLTGIGNPFISHAAADASGMEVIAESVSAGDVSGCDVSGSDVQSVPVGCTDGEDKVVETVVEEVEEETVEVEETEAAETEAADATEVTDAESTGEVLSLYFEYDDEYEVDDHKKFFHDEVVIKDDFTVKQQIPGEMLMGNFLEVECNGTKYKIVVDEEFYDALYEARDVFTYKMKLVSMNSENAYDYWSNLFSEKIYKEIFLPLRGLSDRQIAENYLKDMYPDVLTIPSLIEIRDYMDEYFEGDDYAEYEALSASEQEAVKFYFYEDFLLNFNNEYSDTGACIEYLRMRTYNELNAQELESLKNSCFVLDDMECVFTKYGINMGYLQATEIKEYLVEDLATYKVNLNCNGGTFVAIDYDEEEEEADCEEEEEEEEEDYEEDYDDYDEYYDDEYDDEYDDKYDDSDDDYDEEEEEEEDNVHYEESVYAALVGKTSGSVNYLAHTGICVPEEEEVYRYGFRIVGWSLTKNGKVAFEPGAVLEEDDDELGIHMSKEKPEITLYAIWEKIELDDLEFQDDDVTTVPGKTIYLPFEKTENCSIQTIKVKADTTKYFSVSIDNKAQVVKVTPKVKTLKEYEDTETTVTIYYGKGDDEVYADCTVYLKASDVNYVGDFRCPTNLFLNPVTTKSTFCHLPIFREDDVALKEKDYVVYTSSNAAIVTVSPTGKLVALKEGTVTIKATVTTDKGKVITKSAKVKVGYLPDELVVTNKTKTVKCSKKATYTITAKGVTHLPGVKEKSLNGTICYRIVGDSTGAAKLTGNKIVFPSTVSKGDLVTVVVYLEEKPRVRTEITVMVQ